LCLILVFPIFHELSINYNTLGDLPLRLTCSSLNIFGFVRTARGASYPVKYKSDFFL